MQYRMEQHFRDIYPNFPTLFSGSFLFASNFAPECLKFLVEWFAFWKRFRKSGNFCGKILYQLPLFPKFQILVEWRASKMHPRNFGSERIVRTYYDVQKSVLHVQIRPIDLSITYNWRLGAMYVGVWRV